MARRAARTKAWAAMAAGTVAVAAAATAAASAALILRGLRSTTSILRGFPLSIGAADAPNTPMSNAAAKKDAGQVGVALCARPHAHSPPLCEPRAQGAVTRSQIAVCKG